MLEMTYYAVLDVKSIMLSRDHDLFSAFFKPMSPQKFDQKYANLSIIGMGPNTTDGKNLFKSLITYVEIIRSFSDNEILEYDIM